LSETPKRERLTDQGALMFWEAPTSSDLHALKRDHLQARYDRDAAVRLLVDCLIDSLPPGLETRIRAFIAEVE
jgi:hypothetical protein